MKHRLYIKNFMNDLNNEYIILYIGYTVDIESLYDILKRTGVTHVYRFDRVNDYRLFTICNGALEAWTPSDDLHTLIKNGYSVLQLDFDLSGYYIHY